VAGFKAWLKVGYCVRRGEKAAIRIWMPIPPATKQLERWKAAVGDRAEKPRIRYKLGPGPASGQARGRRASPGRCG
jgi:hypothetical protein